MLPRNEEAISASLESLIKDKYQVYKLSVATDKKTARMTGGNYRSVFKGRGMDFDEVREYKEGDDVRLVDWRVTARQGKTFTKVFREEKERHIYFMLDLRSSMRFGTKQAFKSVIAAHITALLAWSFAEKGDKIGGLLLSDKAMQSFRPSRLQRSLMRFLNEISVKTREKHDLKPIEEEISLQTACWKLRHFCKSGNIVFFISDFSDLTEETLKCFASFAKSNEVILINVYDELEGTCPPPNVYSVTNGNETLSLNMRNPQVQKAYINYFKQRYETLKDFATKYGLHYIPVSTGMNYIDVVANALRRKSK